MPIPQKILIIRFSSLGDIIQLTAFVSYLKELYPKARIDWLTKAQYADMVTAVPGVDRVWGFDSGGQSLRDYCRQLRAEHFDLVCDMHNVWRSMLARHYIGGCRLLVYHKPYFKRWLLFHAHRDLFAPDFHVIGDYCYLIKGESIRLLTALKPPAAALETIDGWLSDFSRSGGPLVAVITGAAWPQKRYPVALWQSLLKTLLEKTDCRLVIIGGKKDTEPALIASALDKSRVRVAQSFSIMETMALLSRCRTAVGNDTGFMHGAEAVGLDVIFILGPTSRHGGGYPNRPGSCAAEASISCRPCSQKGDRPCSQKEQSCFYCLDQEKICDAIIARLS